jgi:hypothetical protein
MSFFTPYSLLSPEERARLPGPVGDGDAELDGVSWREAMSFIFPTKEPNLLV